MRRIGGTWKRELVVYLSLFIAAITFGIIEEEVELAAETHHVLPEITIYTLQGCRPCRRLYRDVLNPKTELGGEFVWRFVDSAEAPDWVDAYPTLWWKIDGKGWKLVGWAGPEHWRAAYKSTLKK